MENYVKPTLGGKGANDANLPPVGLAAAAGFGVGFMSGSNKVGERKEVLEKHGEKLG